MKKVSRQDKTKKSWIRRMNAVSKKQINQVEKEISRLENDIALIEISLADPNFYATPQFMETNKTYKIKQDQLEAKMLE
ncbi:MAG: hypothetical protein IPG48_13400 [Saprospiraceae bacterium]|nr:hypothetical protein [Saprospiraceae bacterium]